MHGLPKWLLLLLCIKFSKGGIKTMFFARGTVSPPLQQENRCNSLNKANLFPLNAGIAKC